MNEAQYRPFARSDFRDLEFRYLESIVAACAAHHVSLIVFTYPYHARYFDLLHSLALWPNFEAWKRALVQTLTQAAAKTGGDIHLFDFAQGSLFSSEPVPPAGDARTQIHWYWESGHFKRALGDTLIARMMGQGGQIGTVLVAGRSSVDAPAMGQSRPKP